MAKLRVYRSRTGGNEWEPLTKGLPQSDCYVNVLARCHGGRFARFVRNLFRHHRRPGLRVGGCGRQLERHRARFAGRAFRGGADAAMIRVIFPAHLRTLARVKAK